MKPSDSLDPWRRLVVAARQVPEAEGGAPFGFATRVAARAMAAEPAPAVLFARLSWRALGVAAMLAVGCVAINYEALAPRGTDEVLLNDVDPVSAVLDLSAGS